MALELDPLNDNDVESLHHDNDIKDEWEDKKDLIYLIDGRHNLFKLSIHRECDSVFCVNLARFKNVLDFIELSIRPFEFVRMSITDRCISFKG